MKVLFAVNNEKISQAIVRKYQEKYKEIISAKNVYYFNAIIKELQRNKNYDRIVISEDLEPFSNRNYEMIDKFIFEKMDGISDEASNGTDGEIPIILICTDRREKGENMLVKLFSIGVYSALLGNDRTIDNLCQMINAPRNKKEAKIYYKIDAEGASYKSERLEDVSETEIQNIINHYKKLGKNEDRYVESFNSIANQYTPEQLKVIVPFLPLSVRAVLEEKCDKYQELMLGSVKEKIKQDKGKAITTRNIKTTKTLENKNAPRMEILDQQINKPNLSNPVVIPSGVNTANVRRMYSEETIKRSQEDDNMFDDILNDINEETDEYRVAPEYNDEVEEVKKKRGRPAKIKPVEELNKPKRGRGRPAKQKEESEQFENGQTTIEDNLLSSSNNNEYQSENNLDDDIFNDNILPGLENDDIFSENNDGIQENNKETILPGIESDEGVLPGLNEEAFENDAEVLPGLNEDIFENVVSEPKQENTDSIFEPAIPNKVETSWESKDNTNETAIKQVNQQENYNLPNLVTGNQKIVAFVGTSKNGTSFLVNNLAAMLSSKGINTAILDLTKNKNAYYIYTQNDESLRNQAYNCINELRIGRPNGIKISNNLTVYTALPNENTDMSDYIKILGTLTNNYSLVLMDCDFDTDYNYFNMSNEIYLVQSYDILTIQPLTAFLKELSDRNVLREDKLRVVINKELKVKGLTEKMIIGGISSYNDPSMSLMKKLFDKDTMKYITIPFEIPTYSKYLEGLVNCEISLKGYSSGLLNALSELADMVYPLISAKPQKNKKDIYNNYDEIQKNQFNRDMDETLNKMRKNY